MGIQEKLRPDGTIEKYNTRLLAKGYTQKEGEDFLYLFTGCSLDHY
jgi:hypothetical protein